MICFKLLFRNLCCILPGHKRNCDRLCSPLCIKCQIRWPAGNEVQYNNSGWGWNWYFNGWKGGKNTEILKTSKRQTVTEDLIRTDKDNEIQNYTADLQSNLYKLDVRYWGQNVDNDEYTELTDYSQFVYAAGSFNPKNITGYDYEKQEVTDGGRENADQTYNFYYARKTYDLQFYNVSQNPLHIPELYTILQIPSYISEVNPAAAVSNSDRKYPSRNE